MAVNVTMTLTPFYLIKVLKFKGKCSSPTPAQIVTVPLTSYFTSIIFSIWFYNRILKKFGNREYPLLIGILITTLSSIPFAFMSPSYSWMVYIAASVQGVGLSMMLNIATSYISDMVGDHDESSAFVYGAYSLFDKVFNGILLAIIGNTVIEDPGWLRGLTSVLPVSAAVFIAALQFLKGKF